MKKNDGGTESDGERRWEKGMLEMQVRLAAQLEAQLEARLAAQEHKLKGELGLKLEHLEEELRSTAVERDELKDALESKTIDLESTKRDLESTKKDLEYERINNESQAQAHEALLKENESLRSKSHIMDNRTQLLQFRPKLEGAYSELLGLYTGKSKVFNLQNKSYISLLRNAPFDILEQLKKKSRKSRLHPINGVCLFLNVEREAEICVKFIDPPTRKVRHETMAAFQRYRERNGLKLPIHFAVSGHPDHLSRDLSSLAGLLHSIVGGESLATALKKFPQVMLVIGKLNPAMEEKYQVGYLQCFLEPDAVISGAVESAASDAEDRKRLLDLKLDIPAIDKISSLWVSIIKTLHSQNTIENQMSKVASLKNSADKCPVARSDEAVTAQWNIDVNTQQTQSEHASAQTPRQTRASTRSKGTGNIMEPTTPGNARRLARRTNRNQPSDLVPRKTRSSTQTKAVSTPGEQRGVTGLRRKRSTRRQPRVVPKAGLSPIQDLSARLMSQFEISEHTPTTPARRPSGSVESRWTSSPESSQSEYGSAASLSSEESPLGHRRGDKYSFAQK